MKYKVGDIVLLYSGESMYISEVDKKHNKYVAFNCADNNQSQEIKDSDIIQLITKI